MQSLLVLNPPVLIKHNLFNEPTFSNIGMYYSLSHLKDNFLIDVIDSFLLSDITAEDGIIYLGCSYDELISLINKKNKIYDAVLINFSWFMKKYLHLSLSDFNEFIYVLKENLNIPIFLCDFYIGHTFYEEFDNVSLLERLPGVDAIFSGIAELDLLEKLIAGNYNNLTGVTFRTVDGNIISNSANLDYPSLISDKFPHPSYDLIDMDLYKKFLIQAKNINLIQEISNSEFYLPLLLSRGCAFNCNFCGLGIGKGNWKSYSLEYAKNLLLRFKNMFSVEGFIFLDSSMNSNPNWFKNILKFLKENSLKCLIPNGLRADLIDEETALLLKDVCDVVLVSLETNNTKIVNEFCGKSFNLNNFNKFIELSYEIELNVKAHYIIGFPDESITDMSRTISHAIYLFDEYNVQPLLEIATPLPGTEFYNYCRDNILFSVSEDEIKREYYFAMESRSLINGFDFTADEVTKIYSLFKEYILDKRMREVFVSPTFRCNDNCIHCLFKGVDIIEKSYEEWVEVINNAKNKGFEIVCFEGGEPSISPDIIKLVSHANTIGFKNILMDTNGRMFANKIFTNKIFEAGLWPVHIALHSWNSECHDSITKSPGSHKQVIQGLRNIITSGYKDRVKITIPFNKSNLSHIEGTVKFCYDIGIREVFLQYLSHKRGLISIDKLPSYKESTDIIKKVIDRFRNSMTVLTQNLPFCEMEGYEYFVLPDIGNTGYFDELGERKSIADELAYGKIKDERCSHCAYNFLCKGYLREKSDY